MNVRGPKSYKDLRTVSEVPCSTFRESAEKRKLLYCSNSLIECMLEAVSYQMPYSLRRLFSTLLVYCNPADPKKLWEMFEDSMSEDFKHFFDFEEKGVRHKVLSHINDILHSMGHDINEYKLIPKNIRASETAKDAKDIHFERNIIVSEQDLLLPKRLNVQQLRSYNTIIDRVFSEKQGTFFVDGPGGTGKTFLYRALLATIRSQGFIALATATSGVAASILPGGRTAHSRFKMPIDIDDNFRCNISKQSLLVCLIRDVKLIVWDEASMAKKNIIEALDTLLRDIMDVDTMFGGKVVVFGGDFRQTLPVVRNGKKKDFIYESLLYSEIWNKLEKLCLSENMRARTDPSFCEYLLRIGNGTERTNCEDKIEIPDSFVIPFTTEEESLDALFSVTYPDLRAFSPDSSMITSRVILTTKNDFVNEINNMLITKFSQRSKTFVAVDETIDPNDQSQFEDFLHSLDPPGLPPYKLTLKKNCPVILLRNLNPCEGLCNGTWLTCCDFRTHVISAKIKSGDFKNIHVFIPRIPLLTSQDEKIPVQFKRTQFPLRLCFAMTINKAQGQTLDFVGIYLREPIFSHGQLYVALSRAKSSNCVKILIRPSTAGSTDDHSTYNVVYDEIIQKAFS
uniref:ATP-dependent DNA helicase n=1 Tax=Nicotiana tabacum TaxID=4097 RepID=A0A1S4AYT7_TOBAC|nr:PREDICTED: ATP-dependent DNA helicase pif1-like [Nicotiana tabacum]XP_016481826.1 PREDICTED: ATP-dependent DNA helicase pif1-like [Nicotiana tabacum]XP_016481827.1 PREDICTED: ATP-dependent DNA helicase pif1-like [Nicotiana tabacum]XP_016481828.1 PREDICTED: ATP-dependent DNA helicase pif1-like [Nicotiana tabacum]XP_016481829.1 PREDICTED: ATP-dependent DNA helicase pif1-like [Nicotiana tabacum]XP_016481830.1 PREDICTED: ATP-dependent DNA helicase pif1-like [Nicotiana tabacum]XP_016481831.1 PR